MSACGHRCGRLLLAEPVVVRSWSRFIRCAKRDTNDQTEGEREMNVSRRSGRSTAKKAVTSLVSATVLAAVLVGGASAASAQSSLEASSTSEPATGTVIGWD